MATEHIVKGIKYGTWLKYAALSEKDQDFLYFITDKGGTIYKGSELVIPKNVIETVTRNASGISTVTEDYYNFEIELFNVNAAGSTSSPVAPSKLQFSVYSKEAVDAIHAVLEGVMDTHRIVYQTGSGTEQDPYVYTYADGMAHNTVSGNETTETFGHVRLTDTINANEDRGATSTYDNGGGTAVTPKAVYDYIESVIGGIGGAMVFKGTIGAAADNPTITQLPTNDYEAGWTYRVITAGTYAGYVCEVGDLIISINNGPSSGSVVINADWTVALNNIDGAVTAANNLDQNTLVLGDGNKTVKKLANGTDRQYIRIKNNVPTWVNHPNTDHGIAHCTCSTATVTSAKTASLSYQKDQGDDSYQLVKGAIVAVRFANDVTPKDHNPTGAATLNVESTGAKPILFRNTALGDNLIKSGDTVTFIYDGTSWNILAIDKQLSGIATSGDYDDLINKAVLYLTDSNTAATVARTIASSDYTLSSNRVLAIKYTYGINADNPTLSINSTTALPIYWHGSAVTNGMILAGDIVTMVNGGGYYNVLAVDRTIDNAPTLNSTNYVTSGGVYNAIQNAVSDAALWWEPLT